jgi:ABC-type proline/glycine betaine transport system substrate-binding protein
MATVNEVMAGIRGAAMGLAVPVYVNGFIERGTAIKTPQAVYMHPNDLHALRRGLYPGRYYNAKPGRGGRRKRRARARRYRQ